MCVFVTRSQTEMGRGRVLAPREELSSKLTGTKLKSQLCLFLLLQVIYINLVAIAQAVPVPNTIMGSSQLAMSSTHHRLTNQHHRNVAGVVFNERRPLSNQITNRNRYFHNGKLSNDDYKLDNIDHNLLSLGMANDTTKNNTKQNRLRHSNIKKRRKYSKVHKSASKENNFQDSKDNRSSSSLNLPRIPSDEENKLASNNTNNTIQYSVINVYFNKTNNRTNNSYNSDTQNNSAKMKQPFSEWNQDIISNVNDRNGPFSIDNSFPNKSPDLRKTNSSSSDSSKHEINKHFQRINSSPSEVLHSSAQEKTLLGSSHGSDWGDWSDWTDWTGWRDGNNLSDGSDLSDRSDLDDGSDWRDWSDESDESDWSDASDRKDWNDWNNGRESFPRRSPRCVNILANVICLGRGN